MKTFLGLHNNALTVKLHVLFRHVFTSQRQKARAKFVCNHLNKWLILQKQKCIPDIPQNQMARYLWDSMNRVDRALARLTKNIHSGLGVCIDSSPDCPHTFIYSSKPER